MLKETGSIFVQIGDENVHLMRCLLDEVFGEKNSVVMITFCKTGYATLGNAINDYIIWYAKDKEQMKTRNIYLRKTDGDEKPEDPSFAYLYTKNGEIIRPKEQ